MKTNLVNLIKKVQMDLGEDVFEISNHTLSSVMSDMEQINEVYNEGDLTKNYVKFATELLGGKYGEEFTEEIIQAFGETIKTNINDFKESYQKKSSSIKEILPSVFIHTSMSSIIMESLLVNLTRAARLHIKFHNKTKVNEKWTEYKVMEVALKYKNISEFIREEPTAYRWGVRMGLKDKISITIKQK